MRVTDFVGVFGFIWDSKAMPPFTSLGIAMSGVCARRQGVPHHLPPERYIRWMALPRCQEARGHGIPAPLIWKLSHSSE